MDCLKMLFIRHGEFTYKVPCGKCPYCLVNKRSQWMFRLYHEMQGQKHPGWVVTFTYDERHVKRVGDGRLSLRFRDLQLFFKKMRKDKWYCKYVAVGEYGGETHRPHYHVLLWTDCPVDKLENYWTWIYKDGHSEKLGHLYIDRMSMAAAMYSMKYIIQPKQKQVDGIEKTRAQFSKGIGLGYLTTEVYNFHTENYENPVFWSWVDGHKVALPRYYRSKIFTVYQQREESRKLKSKKSLANMQRFRDLRALGVSGIRKYLAELRVHNAAQILKTVKYNQTL